MTVFNLGSINIDNFYTVPHLPRLGETIAATGLRTGLGGKGANQSVAAAQARADVVHIGMVGPEGQWCVDRLADFGVDTTYVGVSDDPTGHANITVDPAGENAITAFPGANLKQDLGLIEAALGIAGPGDWLVLQNETSHQIDAAKLALSKGTKIAYSAAPFDEMAVKALLPLTTVLMVNAIEAEQLSNALGMAIEALPVPQLLVTKGQEGAVWFDRETGEMVDVPAFPVIPLDTTGAGDIFAGFVVAGMAQRLAPRDTLTRAAAAAALQVTKKGTVDAIPALEEVLEFIGKP